ncbi:carboxypeptidase regulatory-like domain-containing protein [Methanobacterium sp. BAmetb5]|uniref:carboxypeptidase regulatory-like domain-containing protein n=1 Tax=Methanobacterium sp. BAmetb5 TaxID=2025351 RepID=UPI0025F73655|nr:carboxypeptidase regulatory-like domain-containing protein [Methanobacterium sp. BAmetb5]
MKYEKHGAVLLTIILAVILCSAVSAAESSDTPVNSSADISGIQSDTSAGFDENNSDSSMVDPIISGTVIESGSNTGLGGVTIRVWDTSDNLMAETITGADGSYQVNFNNPGTVFKVAAIRTGYLSYLKEITVTPNATNPADPNLYGTADFRVYALPAYSGNASSYVLNVGAIPGILLDVYAGKSNAWVDSKVIPYSEGVGIPLEVRLLSGDLLAGLLNVNSTGGQGVVTGGILPQNLPALLQLLGLDLGALVGVADSSYPPAASGGSSVISLDLSLLNLIQLINLGVINANSSITPDFITGALTSSSSVGSTANIEVLGGLLEIEAFNVQATAIANGEPGGATAHYDWSVADIRLLGISILDQLRITGVVQLPGVLRIALGDKTEITSPDGTYAFASGDALNIELLNLIPGYELLTLTLGHAEAEATVPLGGLDAGTADLGIEKSVNNSNPNYHNEVVFTLTAHNYGPDDATSVQVNDLLPAGFEWVSDDSNSSYDPITGIWTIGDLANGESMVLHIVARVTASNTSLTNMALINGTEQDPEPGNDQDSVTVTVGPASDLEVIKDVDNHTPHYLDNITYTLTIHNNGPDNATGVTSVDLLPVGLRYVSDDGNGSYNPTTGLWTIGTLANGANAILHILAQVITSNTQITNIATVNGTNYDHNDTNNQTNTTITVPPASDLTITKTVDNPTPHYLDNITYIITVHNNGPDSAINVNVTDILSSGLRYIFDNSNGSYNPNTGLWNIGTLTNGSSAILNILAQVIVSNTQITNIATVNGTNYDHNDTNNQTNTTITVPPASDLTITKTVDNSTPDYLETITYTITVHNNGPDNATGVVSHDVLPTGLRYISDNSNGSYNPTTGLWTIGNLANGANAVLHILAQVIVSNTTITNIANVTATEYDQNSTNNEINTTITVPPSSDLGIAITVDNAYPQYLDYVEFTLTAHNYGPDDSPNVKVYFTAPAGLRYVSDDSNGAFNSTTGLWSIGYMATNTLAVMHLVMQAMVSNVQMTVEAVITDPDPVYAAGYYDPNPDNNRASVSVRPYSVSDPDNPSTTNPNTSSGKYYGSSGKTIGMQTTGIPLGGILLALLAIFTGICVSKQR